MSQTVGENSLNAGDVGYHPLTATKPLKSMALVVDDMAYAYCNNDDCEKDKWWLQKPPSEYSAGGPKCPECGTTKVTVGGGGETADTAPTESRETARTGDGGQGGSTARPARVDDDSGGQPPAPQVDQNAVEAGQKTAELALNVAGSGGSPEAEAEATESAMTAIGSALATMGQKVAQNKRENAQRAKQADQSSIRAVEDYVSCPECETQITDLPPKGKQFRCPGCDLLLENV